MSVFYTITDYNQNNYHLQKVLHNEEGKVLYSFESRLTFNINEEVFKLDEVRKIYEEKISKVLYKSLTARSKDDFLVCWELCKVKNCDAIVTFNIDLDSKLFNIGFYTKTEEELKNLVKVVEELVAQSGITEIKDEEVVPIRVWYLTNNGPSYRTKYIKCPRYEEVASNYPENVQKKLQNLIELKNPIDIGKLIFWMGDPGTGKTYSVRALIREWKEKFTIHLISDPENFFENVGYVNEVITRASEGQGNLFVIEDSPRAVLSEARSSVDTYSMGRLLNLTDGILGQGLEILFLMTTNDDIKDIDRAFLRDGRCLQRLRFEPFDKAEATAWLSSQGVDLDLEKKEYVLSELYALKKNQGADVDSLLNSTEIGFTC